MTPERIASLRAGVEYWKNRYGHHSFELSVDARELTALLDEREELRERLYRSATVCPKDGCMLWRGHVEPHATAEEVSAALANAAPTKEQPSRLVTKTCRKCDVTTHTTEECECVCYHGGSDGNCPYHDEALAKGQS